MKFKWRLLAYALALALALGYVQWRSRELAPVQVTVLGQGMVSLEGKVYPVDQLATQVRTLVNHDAHPTVQVTVPGSSPSTILLPVLDALHEGGVADVQVIATP